MHESLLGNGCGAPEMALKLCGFVEADNFLKYTCYEGLRVLRSCCKDLCFWHSICEVKQNFSGEPNLSWTGEWNHLFEGYIGTEETICLHLGTLHEYNSLCTIFTVCYDTD